MILVRQTSEGIDAESREQRPEWPMSMTCPALIRKEHNIENNFFWFLGGAGVSKQ